MAVPAFDAQAPASELATTGPSVPMEAGPSPTVVAPPTTISIPLGAERGAMVVTTTGDPPSDVAPTTLTTTASTTTASTTTTSTTTASTTTTGQPATPAGVGADALRRVRFDWRSGLPDWDIEFLGPRSGLRALTYPRERRIEVFVRADDTPESLHRVVAHEIGHLVDVELNSESDRDRWRAERGFSDSVAWWPSESNPDFATGAGDFAEAFAVWETGVTSLSTVAGQPDGADLALLEELAAG